MAVGKGLGAAKVAVEEAQKNGPIQEYPKFSLKIADEETSVTKQVRFLNPEDVITFIEHWTEYKNGWKRNYACPNEGVLGADKCVTCRGKKGEDYVSDQRKHAHMIELINREVGQTEVWKFSPMAMAVILQVNEENGNVSDRDFNITFKQNDPEVTGIKAKFVYEITPVTTEPKPLSKADKELKRYDLESLIPKYDEENLGRIASMTSEQSKKGGVAKPAATAADFVSQALGNKGGKNLLDEFASITKPKATPAAAEATEEATPEQTEDFLKLLNDM